MELDEICKEVLYPVLSQEVQRRKHALERNLKSQDLLAQVEEVASLAAKFKSSSHSEKMLMSKYQIDFCLKMLAKFYKENKSTIIRDRSDPPKLAVYTVLGHGLEQVLNKKGLFGRYLREFAD